MSRQMFVIRQTRWQSSHSGLPDGSRVGRRVEARGAACLVVLALCLLGAPAALAGAPVHGPLPAANIEGLNHACGSAVDSEGNVYVSSASESKVKVYNPSHSELTSIPNTNEPCGLAVDSEGRLYVSERSTGNVVRYIPNAYPLAGAPTYSGPEAFDSSGEAKGISVDPTDDRLYVAEGSRISVFQPDGTTGQDEIQYFAVEAHVTGGTFTLDFEGQDTAPIAFDASPQQVQAALEALSTIGAGNVSVVEGDGGERSYLVTFTHALGSQKLPLLSADSTGLSEGSVGFVNMVTEGFASSGQIGEGELTDATAVAAYTYDPVGGLNRRSEKAQRYVFAADSATNTVKVLAGPDPSALEERAPIEGGSTPQGSFGFGSAGAALAVEWGSGHLFVYDAAHGVVDEFEAGGRYLDQVEPAGLTDAGPSGLAVLPERSAVQEFTLAGAVGGSYRLGYKGSHTEPIPLFSSPTTVRSALEALPGIGANVAVRGSEGGDTNRQYVVTFTGALASHPASAITVDLTGLTGNFPAAETRRRPGYGPGRLYLTSGGGAGAKLLAFASLPPASRPPMPLLSHVLPTARAVAVDSAGDVYAAANKEVRIYDPSGAEVTKFIDKELPYGLAVDSKGRVYVLDEGKGPSTLTEVATYYTPSSYPPTATTTYSRHEQPILALADHVGDPIGHSGGLGVFKVLTVNPGPSAGKDHVFIGATDAIFELGSADEGSPLLNSDFASAAWGGTVSGVGACGANGDVYVATNAGLSARVTVIDPTGTRALATINGTEAPRGLLGIEDPAIAVDQVDCHVLTFAPANGAAREYDASGGFVAEFGEFSPNGGKYGIAVDNSSGPNQSTVYIAHDEVKPGTPDLWAFGPTSYGEPPIAVTGGASSLGAGDATLEGTIDPRGFVPTACRFEYLPDAQYLANGKTFAGATAAPCAESPGSIGAGFQPVPVHADVSGLAPGARYRYRLVAEGKFGGSEGDAGLFGPPGLITRSALSVLYQEATLRAGIDPAGRRTTYRFEYGPAEGVYDHATPPAEVAPGEEEVAVEAPLTGLQEGVTYHFRAIAENDVGTVEGPDLELTTLTRGANQVCPNPEFRIGLSANLPDCRAYELVSPAETAGTSPKASGEGGEFNYALTPPRGSSAGERLSFFTRNTIPGFDGNGELDGYRSERAGGDHPLAGWTTRFVGPTYSQSAANGPIGVGVSGDQLFSAWVIPPGEVFADTLPGGLNLRTPAGFEQLGRGSLGVDPRPRVNFLGDAGARIIFGSSAHLEEDAPPSGTQAVYERAAGGTSAQVISLQPDGQPFGGSAAFVASADEGSTVVFRAGGALYVHRNGATVEAAESPDVFAGVSAGGERVFYTEASSGFLPDALFVCELAAGPCAGPEASHEATRIAENGIFVTVSPDGSRVLFTSKDALTGSEASENGEVAAAGQPNLYLWQDGETRFLGGLDLKDFVGFGGDTATALPFWSEAASEETGGSRAVSPTRSTPDGRTIVFQSHARLTSYDNGGFGEVYRYVSDAPPGERLACISCDPSGAQPSSDAMLQDRRPLKPAAIASAPIFNLTDDGREVFFQSFDRLLPEDANSAEDVYEWQAPGVGGCKRRGGCLALISSGQGEHDSYLYSMSADGHDVFFWTEEKLVPRDVAGSKSIYDARVDGGIPDPPAREGCQGDACQGAGSVPPVLPAPPSATLIEGGNVGNGAACPKGSHKVRRSGKARCVRPHKQRHHAKRRGRHDGRRARR